MTNVLFILNDPPYDGGRSYNALRIATVLSLHASYYVRVILLGAAIACAQEGAQVGTSRYDTLPLLRAISVHGGEICACDSCIEGGRIDPGSLVAICRSCALEELTGWIGQADRLLVF